MPARRACLVALAEVPTAKSILDSVEIKDEVKTALKAYRALKQADEFKTWFPEEEILKILGNPTFPVYGRNLGAIIKKLPKGRRVTEAAAEKAIRAVLLNQVPASSLDKRLADLKAQKKGSVLRALGDNELAEMVELFVGKPGGSPSSDSLLGQYVAETGATIRLRSFPLTETGKKEGVKRLEVAVSQESFAAFEKYFGREEFLTIVGHALLVQGGKVKGLRFDALRLPHLGLAMPMVVMKTTEGQRTTQFLELFETLGNGWHHVAALPWLIPGYCATGGYECCTHWIGNMPVGDKLVDTYTFPGRWENNREKPRAKKLKAYEGQSELVRRVWQVPGHEQFAEMLGQRQANLRSDFATSDGIARTLLGPTSLERVPVVFRVVEDHQAEIPDDYQVAQ